MADANPPQPEEAPKPEKPRSAPTHPPRTSRGSNPDRALLALLLFIAMSVGGYFLFSELRRHSKIQDCLMAGHVNCDPDQVSIIDR